MRDDAPIPFSLPVEEAIGVKNNWPLETPPATDIHHAHVGITNNPIKELGDVPKTHSGDYSANPILATTQGKRKYIPGPDISQHCPRLRLPT
ncbi:unnamed protein product [Nesidiocoris tenuis]|uniref:Uncharacterized protein n=1 Tax=Nesidiocoris tenuis TaxID=355587 RepID=A0A6H5HBI1_9HEMI|nr:unnamed protein product [Nesidiocoris tenuis]CAB0015080.1 unnamed protein product [Nesidiocoris tenuis]